MLVVWQSNDHGVGLRVFNRRLEVSGGSGNAPLCREYLGALAGTRVYGRNPVASPLTVERHGVKHADQAGAKQCD